MMQVLTAKKIKWEENPPKTIFYPLKGFELLYV